MGDDIRDAAIVRHTIELGRSLGLRVVAEGVECGEAHERLAAMGCDQGQGFLYSPAVPAEDFDACVERAEALRMPEPVGRVPLLASRRVA
jgi:EAL domain-containing protein (putative c-di-GMP-specific phosphodiesterase class I)